MWFSLFATILILAVVFYQGLQGIFTAFINCLLTVLAAALAFGLYENVYYSLLIDFEPDRGRAIALVGIFVLSLLIARVIVDKLITDNMEFHVLVDRIGGGVFGAITSMLIIGFLALGFQMLPFGPSIMGFERFTVVETTSNKPLIVPESAERRNRDEADGVYRDAVNWENTKKIRNAVWLGPDSFTVGLVSYLSDNALQGEHRFRAFHPEFLDYLHEMRDGLHLESLSSVPPDALTIRNYRYLPESEPIYKIEITADGSDNVLNPVPIDEEPLPGKRRLVVNVTVRESAEEAKDKNHIYFTASQVQLLAREEEGDPVEAYELAGISDYKNTELIVRVFPSEDIIRPREGGKAELSFMFEVPDTPTFKPWMIRYKQNAYAEIRPTQQQREDDQGAGDTSADTGNAGQDAGSNLDLPDIDPGTTPDQGTDGGTNTSFGPTGDSRDDPDVNPKGRVHGVNLSERDPVFSDELPFVLTQYSTGTNFQRGGNNSISGTRDFTAYLTPDWQPIEGDKPPIERFEVPDNVRMLQLPVAKLQPGSWLGQIFGTMKDQLQNFYLIDTNEREHMPVGMFAIARIGGRDVLQLTYLDEISRGFARIPQFSRIKPRDLKGKYAYVFLFHLPPGTKASRLRTGNKELNLEGMNVVAPR